LAGLDFVDQPEVWVATTETEVPAWARTEQLLGEAGDYIRQIVVRILEQAKNGEC
jgi:hypothetical protein